MSVVDAYIQPIGDDDPCGPDLEYDPLFLEFSQACAVKPEEQYGDTITEEVPPDWKVVLQLSMQLLERSRDLRVCVPFTRALMQMQGLPGIAIGLQLIEKLLERYWDEVHPQLDPDDDYDPIIRVNTLAALCDGAVFLRDILDAVIIASRLHGRVTLRDIDVATGETEASETFTPLSSGLIDAIFTEAELDELSFIDESLQSASASITAIESLLTARVGAAQSINLNGLLKPVERAGKFVAERLRQRLGNAVADGDDVDEQVGAGESKSTVRRGEIADRNDVLRALEKIVSYYEQHEPSSPVPLLLMRAHRLATKNFLEIMEDLAPDGLNQVYSVSGTQSAS